MDKGKARLKSILNFKCPKCLHTNLFESKIYKLRTLGKMKDKCAHCSENFMPEPGFYFGAMYVSYTLITGQFILLFAIVNLLGIDWGIWEFISFFLVILVLLAPVNFRLSRVIWLNIFVSYDNRYDEM